ncbi:MAG: DUF4159 domain-containing protein [Luteitalea sp.]|nr:DUF4159 domain-containing protein [Luteitalea sp.]
MLTLAAGLGVGVWLFTTSGSVRLADAQESEPPPTSAEAIGPQEPGSVTAGLDVPDARFAGLRWRFTRVRYRSHDLESAMYRRRYWSEPWAVDGPAAEQNLSRRIRTVTSIQVDEPIVLTLEDPELWDNPWIYFVEPGTLTLQENEVPILREFLLRGGTAVFDDFHGPIEWENLQRELQRVFPDRPIVELPQEHPVFHCFYALDEYPQIPGVGSFMRGRMWEKGGIDPKLRAIVDDHGRAMALINWNTDIGDGWEWSNAEEYPGYIVHTANAYRIMINEVVYALTH